MALVIVQHKSQINGSAIPGTFTLTSTPTTGNLVIAMVGVNIAKGSLTLNSTDWHILKIAGDSADATTYNVVLARYAQIGDTSTLPAFATAGSTYSAYMVWEVSGVSGVLADDIIGVYRDNEIGSVTTFPLSEMICPVNGTLALVAASRYNGSSDASLSGWTGDEAQHNSGNYGSVFGAHKSFNDGDLISGSLSLPVTGNPGGWAMILLGDGTRPTRPFIRQVGKLQGSNGSGHPGSMNLGMNPIDGSLILAGLNWEHGNATSPTYNTTDWTSQCHADGASGNQIHVLGRYAASDNGLSMPALTTAGAAFYQLWMVEVIGVTGAFIDDVVFADAARQASGASMTTTSRSTTDTNQLAIVFASNYNASTELALSGSFNTLARSTESGSYGSCRLGQKELPLAAATVQTTITESSSGDAAAWAQLVIAGGVGGGGGGSTPTNVQVIIVTTG